MPLVGDDAVPLYNIYGILAHLLYKTMFAHTISMPAQVKGFV
jgi:hypothetical protein